MPLDYLDCSLAGIDTMVRQMAVGSPTERKILVGSIRQRILAVSRPHPLRVAVDGVDAAGKTTLAEELARLLEARGRPVIRASIDGFHRPRADRIRRGADSPEGYYFDSFDYEALRQALLEPLGPGGDRRYRTAVFDYRADRPCDGRADLAAEDAVLLFDGVFLLRPELNAFWDFRLFLDVRFEEVVRRALARDASLFGSAEETRWRYEQRYIPGQRIYLDTIEPRRLADLVVANDDPARPAILSP